MLIRELRTHLSGRVPSKHQMQRQAVSSELRRMRAEGIALTAPNKPTHGRCREVKAMPAGLKAPQRAAWMAKSILKPEQVEALRKPPTGNGGAQSDSGDHDCSRRRAIHQGTYHRCTSICHAPETHRDNDGAMKQEKSQNADANASRRDGAGWNHR